MSDNTPQAARDAEDFLQNRLSPVRAEALEMGSQCPICHIPYNTGSADSSDSSDPKDMKNAVRITICSHQFCQTCLESWVRSPQQSSNTCPVCRAVLFGSRLGTLPALSAQLIREMGTDRIWHLLSDHWNTSREQHRALLEARARGGWGPPDSATYAAIQACADRQAALLDQAGAILTRTRPTEGPAPAEE